MKDAKSKERQEFEDWYLEDGGDKRSVVHDGCAYVYQHTQISWESWEASAIRNENDMDELTDKLEKSVRELTNIIVSLKSNINCI